eukprot:TRINITY_DN20830_c0_g3_i1.p1 TRINITY_DN20830_c0_g3~~TRINITY_DN20830_c0_g3_i1.p1  ORF type:complete len:402 (-),score=93.60 TRINITY_DN20830_c0_g3_i1:81-1178(-)
MAGAATEDAGGRPPIAGDSASAKGAGAGGAGAGAAGGAASASAGAGDPFGALRALEAPAAALAYVLTSLAMSLMTKWAASSWRFPGSSFLLLIECIATVAALVLAAPAGKPYRPLDAKILRQLPLVTFAKALNMYLSFVAMRRTSLPVYNVLKRLQPVYALLQDWAIRGAVATSWELAGVCAICFGTVVTGTGDEEFDVGGYGVALLAAACQSLCLVLARRAQDSVPGLSSVDLLFYTAFYNCFLFLPLSLSEATEIRSFLDTPGEPVRFIYFVIPYVLLGAMLNFTTFWCTAANSPLATAVAGNAKGAVSTLAGVLAFGARLTPVGWFGLSGNTLGGLVFSLAQASKKKRGALAEASGAAKKAP